MLLRGIFRRLTLFGLPSFVIAAFKALEILQDAQRKVEGARREARDVRPQSRAAASIDTVANAAVINTSADNIIVDAVIVVDIDDVEVILSQDSGRVSAVRSSHECG